jgi:5-(hydroxymethyl)furfural/furfural oxidase
MPTIPRGNTNIPTIMVAEKLADAMLSDSSAA